MPVSPSTTRCSTSSRTCGRSAPASRCRWARSSSPGARRASGCALPNSKIMIHQGTAGFRGAPTDIEIHAQEVLSMRERVAEIIARHSNRPLEAVMKDIDRDHFMSPRGGGRVRDRGRNREAGKWRSGSLSASSASPLLGWRAWCLRADGRLQSVLYDNVWEPGRPLVAACPHGHAAPSLECACGIYAARRPEDALVYLTGRDKASVVGRLLGRVALWGLVVEGEQGWRAQHAYPFGLAYERSGSEVRVVRPPLLPRSLSQVVGRSSAC